MKVNNLWLNCGLDTERLVNEFRNLFKKVVYLKQLLLPIGYCRLLLEIKIFIIKTIYSVSSAMIRRLQFMKCYITCGFTNWLFYGCRNQPKFRHSNIFYRSLHFK